MLSSKILQPMMKQFAWHVISKVMNFVGRIYFVFSTVSLVMVRPLKQRAQFETPHFHFFFAS